MDQWSDGTLKVGFYLVLGAAVLLGMWLNIEQHACPVPRSMLSAENAPPPCFEFWFNRYQALIGAIVAFSTAVVAFSPAFGQLKELRKQNYQNEFASLKARSFEIAEAKDYFFALSSGIEIANRSAQYLTDQHPTLWSDRTKIDRFFSAKEHLGADMQGIEKNIVLIPTAAHILETRKRLIDTAYKFGNVMSRINTRLHESDMGPIYRDSLTMAWVNSMTDVNRMNDLNEEWRKIGQEYFDAMVREEVRLEKALVIAQARAFS